MTSVKGDETKVPSEAQQAAHLAYLERFLRGGFQALRLLDKLAEDSSNQGEAGNRSSSVGPEIAVKLFAACAAEPSLLSAVYWVVCAYVLLGGVLPIDLVKLIDGLLRSCRQSCGGYAPHPQHEPTILATLSAIQLVLLLHPEESQHCSEDWEATAKYVISLRLSDGSFCIREECPSGGDCRFVYASLNALTLLSADFGAEAAAAALGNREEMQETATWLLRCQNLDGGFGCRPDGECESHAGHTFCALASLTLLGAVDRIPQRGRLRLSRWLGDRQCPTGGLNGRPGKTGDVCYTWWTLASVALAPDHDTVTPSGLYDVSALQSFVTKCSSEEGGIAPRVDEDPDPFHTFFGLAGLSLLAHAEGVAKHRLPPAGVPSSLDQLSPSVALPWGFSKVCGKS